MILRKPYAFFIKYFKLIHLIMAVLIGILIMQTNAFLTFFNEYINSNTILIKQDILSEVFFNFTFIYISLVLILDMIVWILLDFKQKKRLFYIINFVGYALVLVLYLYIRSLMLTISEQVVDARLIMTVRDLVIIAFSFQTVSMFVVISRFLGFDIKKFDFENDIKELNLNAEDNEEYEFNLNVDTQTIKRKITETFRNFRYYFKENLRIIIPIFLLIIVGAGFVIYKSITGHVTTYRENQEFNVPNYKLNFVDSYITNKDYHMNNILEDESLVVVKFKVKTTNNTEHFNFGKFALQINDYKFYHTAKYNDALRDLGDAYTNQKISKEYREFLLIYEIPNNLVNSKKELIYVNKMASSILQRDTITKISLAPHNLDVKQEVKTIALNEEITLNDNLFNIKTFNLTKVEMAEQFNVNYKKCINDNECYNFYEPLQASFSGGYDKILLKVGLDIKNKESEEVITEQLIKNYSKITYKINDVSHTVYLTSSKKLNRVSSKFFFFEIPKEAYIAEKIDFIFTIRGETLVYNIK